MNESIVTRRSMADWVRTRPLTHARLFALALVVAGLGGAAAYGILGAPSSGIDDADITMVYGRNLADGFGYVYRPLGERVEGSTSLLWTLVTAFWFVFDPNSFGSLFLVTGALGVVTAHAALTLARAASPDRRGVSFTALLLGAAATFHGWSAGTLMDLALWTAVLTLACSALAAPATKGSFWLAALGLVGLVLTRPESLVLAPLGALVHGGALFLHGVPRTTVRARTLGLLAVATTAIAITTGFRVFYFGFPFPNTYYAKVGGDRLYTALAGLRYVIWFLRTSPMTLLLALVLGFESIALIRDVFARLRGRALAIPSDRVTRGVLAASLLVGFSLRLLEGGDHFAGHRVLQPFVPLGAALVGSSLAARLPHLGAGLGARAGTVVFVGLSLALPIEWWLFARGPAEGIRGELDLAVTQRQLGEKLDDLFASDVVPARTDAALPVRAPSLGVVAAGGIAFAYPGPVHDLLGLNWVRMAHASSERVGLAGHASFDEAVFWETPSAIVLPEKRGKKPADACDVYDAWYDEVLEGLLSSPRFRSEYRAAVVPVGPSYLQFFVRRDFAPAARGSVELLEWPADAGERTTCRLSGGGGS